MLGVDRAGSVPAPAREKVAEVGLGPARFLDVDMATFADGEPFDAGVGRLVPLSQADPVAVLRHLVGLGRPGGAVAFRELARHPLPYPRRPLLERVFGRIFDPFGRAAGSTRRSGRRRSSSRPLGRRPRPRRRRSPGPGRRRVVRHTVVERVAKTSRCRFTG